MQTLPFSFTVLDTETTGFLPRVNRVIEFASMRTENGKVVDTCEELFALEGEVPPHIRVLTRIRDEDLQGKAKFEEKRDDIRAHIGEDTLIVGQNLGFDIGMLKGEGIDLSGRAWVDTSLLASLVFPELRSYSLGYLSRVLQLNHSPMHRALGDVRATHELFLKIWERLSELPSDLLTHAKGIMSRSSEGYRILFDALQEQNLTKKPAWMNAKTREEKAATDVTHPVPVPQQGIVQIIEEPLLPTYLQGVLNACANDAKTKTVIAVKNLDHALRGLSLPKGARVLCPPLHLLNKDAAKQLMEQETFTVDEALLTLKLHWFSPRLRNDLALHGGEKDVWNGKLACTETSQEYRAQLDVEANVTIVDHRQLIAGLITLTDEHIIIDDASMLEDTATKALGAEVSLDDLRAAAQGDDALTRCTDLLAIWTEQTRSNEDQHFLTKGDLDAPETKGLRAQLAEQLERKDLAPQARFLLEQSLPPLDVANLGSHVMWAELRPNGGLMLHAFPERVDALLEERLFSRHRVTLLCPPGCGQSFPETIPKSRVSQTIDHAVETTSFMPAHFPEDQTTHDLLKNPPPGKTVVLLGSKRIIEQMFVEYTEALEAKGITLICQGLSGGQNRMEAEFIAAGTPALWLLTPWTYEGTDLPSGTLDRLVLDTLPFDHPGQPLMQRRKEHYGSGAFSNYCIPRVEHRLFRLLRTFAKHRKNEGSLLVLDKRIREKDYGRKLRAFIERCGNASGEAAPPATPVQQQLF